MVNIIIFGATELGTKVQESVINKEAKVIAFCDNDTKKINNKYANIIVSSVRNINKYNYDYIIIAVNKYLARNYENILYEFDNNNISQNKIIEFIGNNGFDYNKINKFMNVDKLKCIDLECHLKFDNVYINNFKYEFCDPRNNESILFPKIKTRKETLQEIINENKSICRFGDGEFALIYGDERCRFQNSNIILIKRLKEILKSNNKNNIQIGISDFFGNLDDLRSSGKMVARRFFYDYSREKIYSLLNMEKQYYNAYVFRPYCFVNEKNPSEVFKLIKNIWENRDIVIIEGEYTRMGVGNDLFDNAKSISRIITLNNNAFSKYDEILSEALNLDKNKLVLIALGPTATVLAYDLACKGYQAIDLGHLDIEYEHYLLHATSIVKINNKYTNDVIADNLNNMDNKSNIFNNYCKQIIKKVL